MTVRMGNTLSKAALVFLDWCLSACASFARYEIEMLQTEVNITIHLNAT